MNSLKNLYFDYNFQNLKVEKGKEKIRYTELILLMADNQKDYSEGTPLSLEKASLACSLKDRHTYTELVFLTHSKEILTT